MSCFKVTFLLYSLLFLCFSTNEATENTSFDFQTHPLTSFGCLGDAHMFHNTARLTPDLLVPNSGAGRFFYNKPIRFRQSGDPTLSSFTTYFSFSISNLNPNSIGGGLAFVISLDNEAVGDAGGYLGVPTGAVAVEFDTAMDVEFKDINGNHVGLNLDSMVSSRVVDLNSINVNLRSGRQINSWIDYTGSTQQLYIFISYTNKKPKSPVLSITLNLTQYVDEFMFVGFSGSTQGSTEVHSLESWKFSSAFDTNSNSSSLPPPPPPTTTFKIPTGNSSQPSRSPTKSNPTTHKTQITSKCHIQLCKIVAGAVAGVLTAGSFSLVLYGIKKFYCCYECNVVNTSIYCCILRSTKEKLEARALVS